MSSNLIPSTIQGGSLIGKTSVSKTEILGSSPSLPAMIIELHKLKHFNTAYLASRLSTHRYPMGAVIVKHKFRSIGYNEVKTHPIYANPSLDIYSIHAEISAILNAGNYNLRGASIYIYRETENGVPAMAKPCPDCMRYLIQKGIKKIYYTVGFEPYYMEETCK